MKKVLIIIPYDNIYPPINGGMQRCFHILHQLALHFNVTAIINQEKESFLKALQDFPALASVILHSTNYRRPIPLLLKPLSKRLQDAVRFRFYKRKWRTTTDSNFLKYYPILNSLVQIQNYDAVILENLDTLNAVDVIRRHNKNAFIIYDTHNVGSLMGMNDVAAGMLSEEHFKAIQNAESSLYKKVDSIFTCSNNDLTEFKVLNKGALNGKVIPNGVHLRLQINNEGVKQTNPSYIIFCGSLGYKPNSEGLEWFYTKVWKLLRAKMPSLQLLVVGSGELPLDLEYLKDDGSLILTGRVDSVAPYYSKSAVAIVPLHSGSGTRLKILEAMGQGVPVVSTTKGAEGIAYRNEENIVIADDETFFAQSLIELLINKEKRWLLQQNAKALVSELYDWNVIGLEMQEYINHSIRDLKAEVSR